MIYEIVNPSDAVTIEADDEFLASVAVIILGEGAYGLYDHKGKVILPIFLFQDPAKLVKWLNEHGVNPSKIDEFYAMHGEKLAVIMESLMYGKPEDRKAVLAMTANMNTDEKAKALAKYNESKRSSMSNIAASASHLASMFREKAASAKKRL